MRLSSLPFFAVMLIPAITCAEDSFVYTRKYDGSVQQQPELQQQQYQYQQQAPYAPQPNGVVTQPAPATGYVNQQGGYQNGYQGGAYGDPGMVADSNQPQVIGNGHVIPATPPGWDSLTTGESNGGGVLNNGNGFNGGYGSNPINTLSGNPITNGQAANGLLNSMATSAPRQSYGNVSVTSDGDMSPRERAMYASFLGSLLQYVQSQPDTVTTSTPGYGGGGWQPVTPAYNTAVPVQGSQPRFGGQQGGNVGLSAPAVPCPNGARGVVGMGC